MSTAVVVQHENGAVAEHKAREVQTFEFQQRAAKLFANSGLFNDIKGQTEQQAIAQAFVKISLGQAMGFSPAESMTGIDIIQGRVAVGASLRAARMQRAGFAWPKMQITPKGCWIPLEYKGEPMLDSAGNQVVVSFTEDDAKAAGLVGKDNYKKNPRNMYFARAITNAQRWYGPGVLGVDILTIEEAEDLEPARAAMPQVVAIPQRRSEVTAPSVAEITEDNFEVLLKQEQERKAAGDPLPVGEQADGTLVVGSIPTEGEMKQGDMLFAQGEDKKARK